MKFQQKTVVISQHFDNVKLFNKLSAVAPWDYYQLQHSPEISTGAIIYNVAKHYDVTAG